MRVGLVASVVLGLGLAGCGPQEAKPAATEQAAAPAATAPPDAATAEPLDPFVVMIGAERWTVLLDKAQEGVREAPEPASAADHTDLYRADAALKRGAAQVIELRNSVCAKGLVTGEACKLPAWPAWALEPPTGDTPIAELDKRSGWLDTVMAPFVEAGCAVGRKADEMFCSVE